MTQKVKRLRPGHAALYDLVEPEPRFPPVGLRHLVYHVFPRKGGVWRSNVNQLLERWPLFTGRKFVSVATCEKLVLSGQIDTVAEVRAALPADAEILPVKNDPQAREVAAWVPNWSRALAAAGPDDAVMYGHAKGVTRPPGSPCHEWARVLYETNLDHWPLVADLLTRFPVAGSFKKRNWYSGSTRLPFHYSGTFFWVRAGEMRRRTWDHVTPDWWGEGPWGGWSNEAWVGTAFKDDEAGTIFHEGSAGTPFNLHEPGPWPEIRRRYAAWVAANPPAREWSPGWVPEPPAVPPPAPPTRVGTLHVITPCTRPANLGRVAASLEPLRARFDLRWHVVHSRGDEPNRFGGPERNDAIERIRNGWLWFLDDDNAAHPRFADALASAVAANPNAAAFVFGQAHKDGSPRLPADPDARVGHIDTAQFVLSRAAVGSLRWPDVRTGDGLFWEAFRKANPGPAVVAVPDAVAVYNALR